MPTRLHLAACLLALLFSACVGQRPARIPQPQPQFYAAEVVFEPKTELAPAGEPVPRLNGTVTVVPPEACQGLCRDVVDAIESKVFVSADGEVSLFVEMEVRETPLVGRLGGVTLKSRATGGEAITPTPTEALRCERFAKQQLDRLAVKAESVIVKIRAVRRSDASVLWDRSIPAHHLIGKHQELRQTYFFDANASRAKPAPLHGDFNKTQELGGNLLAVGTTLAVATAGLSMIPLLSDEELPFLLVYGPPVGVVTMSLLAIGGGALVVSGNQEAALSSQPPPVTFEAAEAVLCTKLTSTNVPAVVRGTDLDGDGIDDADDTCPSQAGNAANGCFDKSSDEGAVRAAVLAALDFSFGEGVEADEQEEPDDGNDDGDDDEDAADDDVPDVIALSVDPDPRPTSLANAEARATYNDIMESRYGATGLKLDPQTTGSLIMFGAMSGLVAASYLSWELFFGPAVASGDASEAILILPVGIGLLGVGFGSYAAMELSIDAMSKGCCVPWLDMPGEP